MLQLSNNTVVVGHHPSQLGPVKTAPRDRLLEEEKPDILVVDKPQDLRRYVDQIAAGEKTGQVTRRLFEETFMDPILFRRDCIPLMQTCRSLGIEEIHFVEIPSYIGNVVPFYLDNKYGDQTTRERIMSLRLREVQHKSPPAAKIMMLVEDTLQLNIYQQMKRLEEFSTDMIQEEKAALADRLCELLTSEMTGDPICMGSTVYSLVKKRTRDNYDQMEEEYRFALRNIFETDSPPESAFHEARQLSDILCELRFSMFKFLADPEGGPFVQRLKKAGKHLDGNIRSGVLREDFLLAMK